MTGPTSLKLTVKLTVNGEVETFKANTVLALLAAKDIDSQMRGIAVALNDSVVPRSAWAETTLTDGDRIEIVKPYRGG